MDTIQRSATIAQTKLAAKDTAQPRSIGRVIVLVPEVADPALLAGRIQLVAEARRQDVLLIGVASAETTEAARRRSLTLLAAFLEGAGTRTSVEVVPEGDCLTVLQTLTGSTDLLACCSGEETPSAGSSWVERVGAHFGRSVYVFEDGSFTRPTTPRLLEGAAAWIGSLVIVAGFFWLQVWLSGQGQGAAVTGWLFASVPAEIGCIALFNSLIG